ncbi:SGNH/GDSL hydrolase family protein [Allorhizocola rhizosphaerae]|uniref:SGNH/GDSL hydrolase family protein n=1 Tax=Allorhizocola rhizosphaerae TaxID=1872709 RepID=UPI000E3EA66F|nr:SGNH/GDSL hydrolase family protein [Allorhizocola rhizosphaerae]
MIFQAGQRVVFIGDSITDAGRTWGDPPFGNGYFNLVRSFVTARHPELGLTWSNHGVGGDTVRHLAARWDTDVIEARPDWLSVMIGINDVWRFFSDGREHEGVPIKEYEDTYRSLLRRAVETTACKLILADPYIIEPDSNDPQRAMTDQYCEVVARLAGEFGALHVPTQLAYDRVLAASKPTDWSDDRIHPNLPGHAVLADAFLKVID